MTETDAYLSIRNLNKRYGGFTAVENLSIDVRREEFLTLLGESGSGKTTMLMAIAGFTMADSGKIMLDGRDITFLPPAKRDIGVVFQNYALFPHLTVAENIAYPLKIRKMNRALVQEKTRRALDLVKLSDKADNYPKQLSGGQQQRVALARSLVYEPRLLLMDEPLGALDKKLREHMQLEIKHLQKLLQITVIYVTHDQSEALTMSDRVAIMRNGKFEQVATPQALYRSPANRFVAEFIGEACVLSVSAVQSTDGLASGRLGDGAVRFHPLGGASQQGPATIMVRPESIRVEMQDGPADSSSQMNRIAGTIAEVVYYGDSTMYHVAIPGDQTIRAKHPNSRISTPLSVGTPVACVWNCEETLHIE